MKGWWKGWAAQPALWLGVQGPCMHSQKDGASVGTSYPTRSDPQLRGCLRALQDPRVPEGGMSCPGALLCSEDFFAVILFFLSRNLGSFSSWCQMPPRHVY